MNFLKFLKKIYQKDVIPMYYRIEYSIWDGGPKAIHNKTLTFKGNQFTKYKLIKYSDHNANYVLYLYNVYNSDGVLLKKVPACSSCYLLNVAYMENITGEYNWKEKTKSINYRENEQAIL